MTEEIKAPEAEPKRAKKIACTVLRDYWTADDARVTAGTVVHLTPEEAMDGVETGALARVKDAAK